MATSPWVTVDPGEPKDAASPRVTMVSLAAALAAANALAPAPASCAAMTTPATSNQPALRRPASADIRPLRSTPAPSIGLYGRRHLSAMGNSSRSGPGRSGSGLG